ncbi:MAG: hypothetical protein AVDCRST_MAG38-2670, partial [uncultured Solirubrobacteraceae bacterium]
DRGAWSTPRRGRPCGRLDPRRPCHLRSPCEPGTEHASAARRARHPDHRASAWPAARRPVADV